MITTPLVLALRIINPLILAQMLQILTEGLPQSDLMSKLLPLGIAFLTIELGLQTIHSETSKLINRCHSLEQFEDMVHRLRERHINVVVHLINGLPFETEKMMIETARYLNKLDIQGVKIHMLHIIKDTGMAKLYEDTKFHVLSKDEYIDIVIKQLEVLDPKIIINRITSDPDKETLVEPTWLLEKCQLLNDIDKEMKKRNTYQGARL